MWPSQAHVLAAVRWSLLVPSRAHVLDAFLLQTPAAASTDGSYSWAHVLGALLLQTPAAASTDGSYSRVYMPVARGTLE